MLALMFNGICHDVTDAASGQGPFTDYSTLPNGQDQSSVGISSDQSIPKFTLNIFQSPARNVSHKEHGAMPRRKRNILFPSGVKLCAQESRQQAISNHLRYFHLRGKVLG